MCTEDQNDQFKPCVSCEHIDCDLFRALRGLVDAVYKLGDIPYNLWQALNHAEDVLDKTAGRGANERE